MNDVNREVAEKVMGWTLKPPCYGANQGWWDGLEEFNVEDWDPLHKIEHAWMVVEKFLFVTLNGAPGRYTCRLIFQYDDVGDGMWGTATADTAPEAICRAALAAKEGEHG